MSESLTIPKWRSRLDERGYDHSVDRIVPPTAEEVDFFNDHQLKLLGEQLGVLNNPDDFVASIGRTSLQRVAMRTHWEEANLRAMGILSPMGDDLLVGDYAELTGDPERIGDLLRWFAQYTAAFDSSTESTVLGEDGTVQNEEFIGERANLKPTDELKGVAIEGGTGMQESDWDASLFLERAMVKGLKAAESYHSINRWDNPPSSHLVRHKINDIYDASGFSLEVVRERPYADVDDHVHVIKRSVSRAIPNPSVINTDEIRSIIDYLAQLQSPENVSKPVHLTPGARRLMNTYLRVIHEHPGPDKNAPFVVIPDSMSFIFRRPPKKV